MLMDSLLPLIDSLLGLQAEPRDLSLTQVSARAVLIFASALLMLRLAHKRFFAHRNALDVLLSLIIASTLARAINGNAGLLPTIGAGFVLVLLHRGITWLAARFPAMGSLVKGRPTPLISGGSLHRPTLRRHDLSEDDLAEDLRLKGISDVATVREATLERNGEISVTDRGSR